MRCIRLTAHKTHGQEKNQTGKFSLVFCLAIINPDLNLEKFIRWFLQALQNLLHQAVPDGHPADR